MPEGKKVRIRVRTVNCIYVGDFLIPPMRNRVSDAINEEQRLFISLTDVVINDKDRSDFIAINKNLIEMLALLTLATTLSGRWLGLDGLLQFFNPRRWRRPAVVAAKPVAVKV